jgi:hypothetical protein
MSQQPFLFFSCGSATQRGSWPPHFWGFLDHIQRRTTVGRTLLDEWSSRRRDLYLTTHNNHNRQTSMPPGGIRTHDLSRRAAAVLRMRPRGHWDRHINVYIYYTLYIKYSKIKSSWHSEVALFRVESNDWIDTWKILWGHQVPWARL